AVTSAPNPAVAAFRNQCSLALPTSIATASPSRQSVSAFLGSRGIPHPVAKSFAVPSGTTPKTGRAWIERSIRPLTTSFNVPSQPSAISKSTSPLSEGKRRASPCSKVTLTSMLCPASRCLTTAVRSASLSAPLPLRIIWTFLLMTGNSPGCDNAKLMVQREGYFVLARSPGQLKNVDFNSNAKRHLMLLPHSELLLATLAVKRQEFVR